MALLLEAIFSNLKVIKNLWRRYVTLTDGSTNQKQMVSHDASLLTELEATTYDTKKARLDMWHIAHAFHVSCRTQFRPRSSLVLTLSEPFQFPSPKHLRVQY